MKPPDGAVEALLSSELFAGLDASLLEHLMPRLQELEIAPGEVLMRQGDDADFLAFVLEGRLEAVFEGETEVRLQDLEAGSVVGEIALVAGGQRSVTVRALERTRVLKLSRETFDHFLEVDPRGMAPLYSALLERIRRTQLAPLLPALFGDLEPETLREVEAAIEWKSLDSGEVLFRQDDTPADSVYFVVVGRLRAVVENGGGERVVAEIGRGELVGEMALLTERARSATVYAVRDCELARLSRAAFERLVAKYPQTMLGTARLLVSRLEHHLTGRTQQATPTGTFAVVPANPEAPVEDFARRLGAALEPFGSVLHLSAEGVDRYLGKAGISQIPDDHAAHFRVAQWLIERENAHKFVIYRADATWSGWSQRSIRNADHILIVADAAADPAPGALEERLESAFSAARAPRRSLILLRAPGAPIAGTARWLDARRVDRHYHLERGAAGDFARLARSLTGHAIGVVFGGGGARGYAHLGVLRAFEELGVPVDALGGTSMGALMAGGSAVGLRISWVIGRALKDRKKLRDKTLPLVSLLAGRYLAVLIDEIFGNRHIEDLPIPYFCISTNLTQAEEIVHRRGPLAQAVRASMAVPGIYPPVTRDGDLLIDGGLFNNLPIEVMASVCGGGPVLAFDVSPPEDLRAAAELPMWLSGWQVLRRQVNPLHHGPAAPGILDILLRTVGVGSVRRQRSEVTAGLAAYYQRLPVGEWGLLDLDAAAKIADTGYQAALEPLRQWWAQTAAVVGREPVRSQPDPPVP